MAELTTLASLERRAKLSTNRFMCPESSMSLLITRMSPTMAARTRLWGLITLLRTPLSHAMGVIPAMSASASEPMNKERLNWRRNLFRIRIRQNAANIIRIAGIFQSPISRLSFCLISEVAWTAPFVYNLSAP
jgi:hypothetical protein